MDSLGIVVAGRCRLNAGQIEQLLGNFAPPAASSDYDIMLSYRQEHESELVAATSDAIAANGVTWTGDNLNVFYDRDCLRHGKRYDAFLMAVARSLTVVPFISLGRYGLSADNTHCLQTLFCVFA
jgi:hypothetical protein